MAWYSDEQYTMIQDCREKKSISASAFKQRTHCGRSGGVKLPSDFKTKKELKAMNGVVEEFNLRKPMTWDKFKSMSNDLKVEYIKWIREYFGAPDKWIVSELFEVSQKTFSLYIVDLGLPSGTGKKKWEKDSFFAWCRGDGIVKEPVKTEREQLKSEVKDCDGDISKPKIVVSKSGSMTFENTSADDALETIKYMLGNKMVNLTVIWEVV